MEQKVILPESFIKTFKPQNSEYALCIPVINEGEKIKNQLQMLKDSGISDSVDVIICDGGSTDGSTSEDVLRNFGVYAIIVKKSPGKLSDQLMLGYYHAVEMGYKGTITMDGNGKDGLEGVWSFIEKLNEGYDFIQGSRYLKGGEAINTPKLREKAIKWIHVPVINCLSGYKYTDTTNGFRGHSARVFLDDRIQPFRYGVFPTYSLIHYLTVVIPRLGYRVTEIPVTRAYPREGKIPTKISPIKGNIDLLKILLNLAVGRYNPKR